MVLCTEIVNVIKSPVTYLDVALPTALPKVLTYRWGESEKPPLVGMRVVVPLGNRRLTGVVADARRLACHVAAKTRQRVPRTTLITSRKTRQSGGI